ncbi:hypothetical protein PSP6_930014 [Paraburkholderia tropica]|nr:hypothetical protein PSP6_930014 [Paraburkholderia tropica]
MQPREMANQGKPGATRGVPWLRLECAKYYRSNARLTWVPGAGGRCGSGVQPLRRPTV